MSSMLATEGVAKLPSPPFITVEGIYNFRDIGGYPVSTSSNHSIRSNILYRCAEPSKITRDGISTAQRLGITHMYDLRSSNEIERNRVAGRGGIVQWEGCQRVFVPVFEDKDYSPEALAGRFKDYASGQPEGFTRAYSEILAGAPKSFRVILLHLAHQPDKPLIVHCTAGKDRTGLICALVLSLCGADDETIAYEYSLTEIGLTHDWKDAVMAHLMQNPALTGNLQGAKNMISAKAENMRLTLKMMEEKFGGAEKYVTEKCGLTENEVGMIRRNLVMDKAAVHAKHNL
ncbi:related to protein-tyrosine phosphatase [Rhynchosporium graminicola]|uniref:Related to protein-tyrosine phosphatase n=2 Tax=Rhynchosporium TaxID=38037 RepID=A0A1E1MH78_RHYSE|nr:related to protein-tyrosine phosphatase [Rhynchosporium commune]CZT48407.1 related to protein-tyrosine phosphatase [Rhynchosporium secalis]